ncbi:MAG: hypothetical protein IJD90_00625, partial [Clostridia bacterium]|nr:hypothetical protein [Clostridia bacterium]
MIITLLFSLNSISVFATSQKRTIIKLVNSKSPDSIIIKWEKVSGAKGYVIYQIAEGKKFKKTVTIKSGKKTTYTFKKLNNDTKYSFKLKSYAKKEGKTIYSAYSKVKSVRTMHLHKYTSHSCRCGDIISFCKCGNIKVVPNKNTNVDNPNVNNPPITDLPTNNPSVDEPIYEETNYNFSQTGYSLVLNDVDENESKIKLTGKPNTVVNSYGKNLLKQTNFKVTGSGVEITQNPDGTLTLNGTATSNLYLYLAGNGTNNSSENPFFGLPVDTQLKGLPLLKSGSINSTNCSFNFSLSKGKENIVIQHIKSGYKSFKITKDIATSERIRGIWLNAISGTEFNNTIIQPCVILNNLTDTTYEKYKEPTSVTLDSIGKGYINYAKETMYLYSLNEFTAFYNIHLKYKELLESGLYKKVITLNGDSICAGSASRISYGSQIAQQYKMNISNKAVGGGTIAYGTTSSSGDNRHWICDTVSSMPENADFVLFSGGINDYWNDVELGILTDGITDKIDNTTFYGALESICRQAKEKWTNAKIGFITTHKIQTTPTRPNILGYTFDDYHTAILEVCKKYNIPVCDLYMASNFDTSKSEYLQYTSDDNNDGINDGVHPTTQGYQLFYIDKIVEFLKTL